MDFDELNNDLKRQRAIEKLMSMIDDVKEYFSFKAEVQRHYYESLIEEGFSREEALYLTNHALGSMEGGSSNGDSE